MAKKHMSGFVPVPFNLLGKLLLPVSLLVCVIAGLDYLFGWGVIPLYVFFVGIGLTIISIYLLLVVPKE